MDLDTMRRRVVNRRAARRSDRWYAINAKDDEPDVAVVRIYGEIWSLGVNAEDLASDLDDITASEIRVEINSPGGDVFDGVAIFNALRSHPARVTTRVDGIAASIASVIAQAGDHRVMLTGSQMMLHEAWGAAIGPADELREFADVLDKQSDVIAAIYAGRSGRPQGRLRRLMDDETYLDADETLREGLADEVLTPKSKASAKATDVAEQEWLKFVQTSVAARVQR